MYKIQSVLIPKSYSLEKAKKWIIEHKFKLKKVDEDVNFYRFRQLDPKYLNKLGYTEYFSKKIKDNEDLSKSNLRITLIIVSKPKSGAGLIDNIKDAFNGRTELPPKIRNMIGREYNDRIQNLKVCRRPLDSIVNNLLNVLSFGSYKKAIQNKNYDSLYHLYIIINDKYGLEKNQVINSFTPTPDSYTECININVPVTGLAINVALGRTQKYMGNEKFIKYDPKNNNCQDFILSFLKANNLGNENDYSFVKQDVISIFNSTPIWLEKIAKTVTDIAGKADVLINGMGLPKKKSYFII